MKRTGLVLILTAMQSWLFSQNADDAILYSWTPMGGTALSMAMGGATGAIGGDFTSASIHPAGLGLYRQSEWGISAGLAVASVNPIDCNCSNCLAYLTKGSIGATGVDAGTTPPELNKEEKSSPP